MEDVKEISKGFINLGEKVMVSDPCCEMGTWCQDTIDNMLKGIYKCDLEMCDTVWGHRVSAIQVTHVDYMNKFLAYKCHSCYIGVDSGQAGIFDYEYYEKYHNGNTDDDWYGTVCDKTISMYNGTEFLDGNTVDGLGFVSSSGYGDGCYDCWVAERDGKVVAIRVEYITEDDEEDM